MQVFLHISGSVLPWGIRSPLVEGARVLPACLTHAWVSLRSAELAMASVRARSLGPHRVCSEKHVSLCHSSLMT